MKNILIIILTCLFTITGLEAQNHWIQLNFPDTLHIKCITTNNFGDIFVGVGSNNGQGGLLRSTNEGLTWELVYDDGTHSILSIDINDDGQIFAGSSNALQPMVMSTDNGNSWERIETPIGYVGNVTLIESYNDELYISMWGSIASLFRSNDYGNTWDTLYRCNSVSEYITSLKFDYLDNILFSVMGFQQNTGGVYKSIDDGVTWELMGLYNHQVSGMDINANSEIFTCDWWLISGDNCGINAWYMDSTEFSLILNGSNFNDLKINSEGDIFSCGPFGVIYSENNGYSFEYFDTISQMSIDLIHISSNDYVYIGHESYLAKSALTTSTDQISSLEKDFIDIYPNPASNSITIKNLKNDKVANVIISNPKGKVVYKNNELDDRIDISRFAPGSYVVEIESSKNRSIKKLIIK